MAEFEQAKKVYDALLQSLDNRGWKYNKFEDDLVITSTVQGEDLPVEFVVHVDPQAEVIRFLSKLPFVFDDEKRIDGALAICAANMHIMNGSFDYDITKGSIIFRLCNSFRDGSVLSDAAFEYIVMVSAITVDRYNDKLLALAKGIISIEQFIEQINNN